MAFKIEYTHQAEIDIYQAIDYYLTNASRKTAKSFYKKLIEAENSLISISHFQIIYDDFHRFPMKTFPYIIIYKIENEKQIIRIYRVFHTSQNPEKYP
ncbi:type II toxin-antitoxin system RelE/ParE family toxin [uncultured Chryseobacterium sp.]|uniref:type II toxin-antitoxin system RelE/ParE family toxin n=1 Tax=uncultured Chryseobacterium sp. TaxID=259322 RepID=UPI002600AB58|nr:type II toxin-antitoxin system RelE/ParE family toxin [uncultured Chryseobacterium sp.]